MKSSVIIFFILFNLDFCLAQVQLKQVFVDGQRQDSSKKIILNAANNDLVLDFGRLSDSVAYVYRIKEISLNWTQSHYPTAHYQNLNGGKYTFEIAPQHSPDIISTVKIEVKEAFWQKWWFWPAVILYVLLIIGIGIYLFFLYDFRQKLKMQYVRNQIASDLHDEVGSNLNSIAIFVALLRKKIKEQPELLPILNKITDNSEETVSLMRDTVWAISPSNDSTEKLLEKMRSFGFEILSAKGIAFDFKSEIETKKDLFSMEQRRNIYLIYKEAINNIAKHSAATKAFCHVSNQNGATQFEIYDNGKGFDLNQSFEGNGLKNYQLRSQDEDLHVGLESAPDNGTTVLIKVF